MLNLNDKETIEIITTQMEAAQARTRITLKYEERVNDFSNSDVWSANVTAQTNLLHEFTELLANKLVQSFNATEGLHETEFMDRFWLKTSADDAEHSTITAFLANKGDNHELLSIVNPLSTDGYLQATDLPTLLQITAQDGPKVDYTEAELKALSALTKALYATGYRFRGVDETVLQPVAGLTFGTKFDNAAPLTNSATITEPGNVRLFVETDDPVASFHVYDDEGHDWMDLGAASEPGNGLAWESTTIPDELVGSNLTLSVNVHSDQNVPALDELFVTAANNAVLMRETDREGQYVLALPDHNDLTVTVDAEQGNISLGYPDATVQVLELVHNYPFLGTWLRGVLPKRPAFN
ncbi:hypothetical protein [Lacticaseibacillus thailandensis]|uniref:Uncharacterized protein n=1 Tax=Lacticaseibacillus thailandensis DSM 22698 = JCM 13996 TaxID=1423810 RepID=A0A0R2C5I4_9LACO|nr:hypothetical protein [Lacticaseibacillus thailandensis]KRM86602.1 hypothetical protein FD19_GL001793 [Lacticaseibacillus thailandensis DSM 22698 = JCM 13996]